MSAYLFEKNRQKKPQLIYNFETNSTSYEKYFSANEDAKKLHTSMRSHISFLFCKWALM